MRTGVSWSWWENLQREKGESLGNLNLWNSLFSDRGIRFKDIRSLSGTPLAIALAGFFLFALNGILHCAFLASLVPRSERGGFAGGAARFALPALALAASAAVTYILIYWLFYNRTGDWLATARQATDREGIALAMTWGRLALTLAGFLFVKVVSDLAKVVLVDRGSWNWPWALLLALKEALLRPRKYFGLYLLLAGFLPLLALAWSWTGGQIVASGWWLLLLVFLLQQLFMATRIGLRLTHLAAARQLYLSRPAAVPKRPPFKVPGPEEA